MLKAFLTYQTNPSSKRIANTVQKVLLELDIKLVNEQYVRPCQILSEEDRILINQCDFLVSLRPEMEENNAYLEQEANFAKDCGKPVVVIAKEDKISSSDFYYISLQKSGEVQAVIEFMQVITDLKSKRNIPTTEPILVQHSLKDEIDKEKWSSQVRSSLRNIRFLFNFKDYNKVLDEASRLFESYPECWRAGIAKSTALVFLIQLEEADKVLDEIIAAFGQNNRALSHAYQNKGWIQSLNFSLGDDKQTIINYFHKSLNYDSRLVVFVDLINFLIRCDQIEEAEAEWNRYLTHFPDAKQEFTNQWKIAGSDFDKKIQKSLLFSTILSTTNTQDEK